MPLTYEHVGSKKPAKINTYMLTRAELLITLCYEIPCSKKNGEKILSFDWAHICTQIQSSMIKCGVFSMFNTYYKNIGVTRGMGNLSTKKYTFLFVHFQIFIFNFLKLLMVVTMMWMVKKAIFTGFCKQIVYGQKINKLPIV